MEVVLVNKSPNFLKTCYVAARTCKSSDKPQDLWYWCNDDGEEKMKKLVCKLVKLGHLSVLEHTSMTFAVSGVSRSLLAQYSRHRIGVSLSVQSQRYVDGSAFGFVIPPSMTDKARAYYEGMAQEIRKAYNTLRTEWDIPRQDARFILPNATTCNFMTTLNLRSFLDVYNKRVQTPGAQWEIVDMFRRMGEALVKEEPWVAELL